MSTTPQRFCEKCGARFVTDACFCEACGQPAAMPSPTPEAPASQEAAAPQPDAGAGKRAKRPVTDIAEPPLQWECQVPVLTNLLHGVGFRQGDGDFGDRD